MVGNASGVGPAGNTALLQTPPIQGDQDQEIPKGPRSSLRTNRPPRPASEKTVLHSNGGRLVDKKPGSITPGSGTAGVPPQATSIRDGSSPANAINVPLKVLLDGVVPDAFVVAGKVSLSAEALKKSPGAEKIGVLKNLIENDAKVDCLAAVLIPVTAASEQGWPRLSVSPLSVTLFVSLKVPGKKLPRILTIKPRALSFEVGTRLINKSWFDGRIIQFSNVRVGPDLIPGEIAVSSNGGVLFEVPGVMPALAKLINAEALNAQASQAATGLAGAPETGGASVPAALGTIFTTEAGRALLLHLITKNVKPYLGLAWRGSINFAVHDGNLVVQAQKGPYKGKWVVLVKNDFLDYLFGEGPPNPDLALDHWCRSVRQQGGQCNLPTYPTPMQLAVRPPNGTIFRDESSGRRKTLPSGSIVREGWHDPSQMDDRGRVLSRVSVAGKTGFVPQADLTPLEFGNVAVQDSKMARSYPELEAKVRSGELLKVTVGTGGSFWEILRSHGLLSRAGEIATLNAHILDVKVLRAGDAIYLPLTVNAKLQ
jgi:hypothetical protein